MYSLYYLVNQDGDINGDKSFVSSFDDIQSAKDRATNDNVQHFSIEENLSEKDSTIVFIQ